MRQRLHLPHEFDGRIWQYGNPASANRRHHHAELELNLVTRGHGVYLLGSRRYEIRRGDLLWLFPAQDHVLIEQSTDFRMWIGVFRHRAIRRLATDTAARPLLQQKWEGDACRRLSQEARRHLEDMLAALSAEGNQPGLYNAGLGYALLQAWRSFDSASRVPVRDLHPAVERASRMIRDGAGAESLAALSRRAGLSSGRLSRLFREQTGYTMVDFRNRQRLERFFDVYGSGQRRTVLDAALEAGFGSYPQFHRVFKKVMGYSPGRYRWKEIDRS